MYASLLPFQFLLLITAYSSPDSSLYSGCSQMKYTLPKLTLPIQPKLPHHIPPQLRHILLLQPLHHATRRRRLRPLPVHARLRHLRHPPRLRGLRAARGLLRQVRQRLLHRGRGQVARDEEVRTGWAAETPCLRRCVVGPGGRIGSGVLSGVAQCVGDLTAGQRQDCVEEAIRRLKAECGGDMFLGKCYARYTTSGAQNYARSNHESPHSESEKTFALIIGLLAGVALLIIFLTFLGRLFSRNGK
ncbi:hypothetical protein SASPL_137987 [Salvia splendens]|uniref:Gnk2-homologous domain-containing protein n=1 Tax=Salvia splendens TaxID=180675 RepID=A0A8X8ZDG6_SALSN|nr:hypothetical protein SASPL_137987 [Salvia splendens]